MISGCLPIYTLTDYTPEMPGGTLKIGNCLGTRRMHYSVDGVSIRSGLLVYPHARKNMPVMTLAFEIPDGRTVELASAEIALVYAPATATTRIRIASLGTTNAREQILDALAPMVGSDRRVGERILPSEFWTNIPLPEEPTGDVRAVLPDIRINGRVFKVPPIDFRRTPRVEWMTPINC
jgi:hypothetical protein